MVLPANATFGGATWRSGLGQERTSWLGLMEAFTLQLLLTATPPWVCHYHPLTFQEKLLHEALFNVEKSAKAKQAVQQLRGGWKRVGSS